MCVKIIKDSRDHKEVRDSFMQLAMTTFGISFTKWYEDGYWMDTYRPYVVAIKDKVVANASVNIIDTMWQGQAKRFIQIGTVMSDPAYRNKGYVRLLMEEIRHDWQAQCDMLYLYANDTVLEFYTKFGFVKANEYQYTIEVSPNATPLKQLDMKLDADRKMLQEYYIKSNPYTALPMLNNEGLLMFYCTTSMKEHVYYSEVYDAIIIAKQTDETLWCMYIYSDCSTPLLELVSSISSTEKVVLGFMPKDTSICKVSKIEIEDETLFVMKGKEQCFDTYQWMLPQLSHA